MVWMGEIALTSVGKRFREVDALARDRRSGCDESGVDPYSGRYKMSCFGCWDGARL